MELRTESTSAASVRVDVRRVFVALAVVIATLNLLNAISIVAGADPERTQYFLLALEGNPSTWLAALLLAATALLATRRR